MFKIYSASAGSGKTYTLTKEYLRLALGEGLMLPNDVPYRGTYFRHILAVTFTNAAANDMKERILRELAGMAQDNPSTDPFLRDLTTALTAIPATDPGFNEQVDEVRRRAKRLFQAILHRYSDFAVSTIDSFTQRLVTAFTDELGLPYSFEVELETDLVLEVAVDNLIERVGTGDMATITAILKQIFDETARAGNSVYTIAESLREFGKIITSDQHYEALSRIAGLQPTELRTIREQLRAFIDGSDARVKALGQRAWQVITDAGLDVDDFAQKSRGPGAFFREVATGDTDRSISDTLRKLFDKGELYPAKVTKALQGIVQSITPDLTTCFEGILLERNTHGQLLALFRAIDPNVRKMGLLQQIRTEFVDLLRKDNRVHISEFNKRIKKIVEEEPVPFLFERLGSRYNHILIDEFQDTSQLQFANLLPLIENALGSNYVNMAVGDGKQAIYRWRGGDMDQIVALHRNQLLDLQRIHGADTWTAERIAALESHIHSEQLGTNYRSARPIIAFNNELFARVARWYMAHNPRIDKVYDQGQQFWQEPADQSPADAHIQFDFIGKDDVPDLTAAMVAQTVAHIRQAQADGYTYGDMAVLTRTKDNSRVIANELNRLGIPLVSADSLSLQFSEPVRFLIALLTMLSRPGQKTLHYEVLYLYHSVVHYRVPNDEQTEELCLAADIADDGPTFDYLAKEGYVLEAGGLSQLSVYELAEKLIHGFRLFDRPHDQPFLFRFLDEILSFSGRQSGHLADFLRYWETVKGKVSVSESLTRDAITIQTIHKSKGLEYPVVIVPFADWSVTPKPNATIWADLSAIDSDLLTTTDANGELVRLLNAQVTIKKDWTEAPGPVAEQCTDEYERTFLENMNLLYVAFTRPTDRLYVLAENKPLKDDITKESSVANWLQRFLQESDLAQQANCVWSDGQSTYLLHQAAPRHASGRTSEPFTESPPVDLEAVNSGSRGQNMQLRRMAERVFDTRTFEIHRERDRKLCAALSLIKGADCVDKTLARLIREGVIRSVEVPDLREALTAIVTHPDLTDVFGYDRRIDTDRSILTRQAATGAPHRVVHRPDGSLVLIQYESVDGSSESHLGTFIDLYKEMGYPVVEGRIVWLSNVPRVEPILLYVS